MRHRAGADKVDFLTQIARQEAQTFPGLNGRTRENDAIDLTCLEHGDALRNSEIGLASPRRTDPESQFGLGQHLHIGGLST